MRVKRLYTYILQAFLPVFFMTFGICLFILLMQFLWKYIEDLVGKGLDNLILAELFLYATLSIIPMALPLAILLASLMTFGNLGERFELLAIKAAGISLLRAMSPLIVVVTLISLGAFFFQNEAMPKINVKITSLMRSIKMKSPELDIPEGSFYNDIDNYNLYVKSKNKDTGMLYDVKIYDVSKGFDNMAVIVCDSAKIRMSSGKDYLLLSLYHGQQFSNFEKPGSNTSRYAKKDNTFVPYGRENFSEKEIVVQFDATFSRIDESSLQGTQLAKNIKELQYSIDSLSKEVDSMNIVDRRFIKSQIYSNNEHLLDLNDNAGRKKEVKEATAGIINVDSVLNELNTQDLNNIYSTASSRFSSASNDLSFRSYTKLDVQGKIRQHNVAWHQKFTLSFACIIFFFIGAPLGAIIRKGGLGMPVVISVILFIIYYIFDNVGRKMARDGVWDVWEGIWLSTFILFPLGVFLTYKAMNDSSLFNVEAYGKYIRKLLRVKPKNASVFEADINPEEVKSISELGADSQTVSDLKSLDSNRLKDVVHNYKLYNYDQKVQPIALAILKERGESFLGLKLKHIEIDKLKSEYDSFFASILLAFGSLIVGVIFAQGISFLFAFAIMPAICYVFLIKAMLHYLDFYSMLDKIKKTDKILAKEYLLYILFFLIGVIIFPYLLYQMRKEMKRIV